MELPPLPIEFLRRRGPKPPPNPHGQCVFPVPPIGFLRNDGKVFRGLDKRKDGTLVERWGSLVSWEKNQTRLRSEEHRAKRYDYLREYMSRPENKGLSVAYTKRNRLKNLESSRASERADYHRSKLDPVKNDKRKARERIRSRQRRLKDGYSDWRRTYNRGWIKRRRASDPKFRIKSNIRSAISGALKGRKKFGRFEELVGCSVDFLLGYISQRFSPGMSWDNWGMRGWHIDHVLPCSKFDLSKKSEQRKCFHYTNLQPLWAHENESKRAKVWVTLPLL